MSHKSLTRVLALDLHPRRFGYVVIEGPDRLLDWGVRNCRRKGNRSDVLIRRRLRPLLKLWRPSFLVIRGAPQIPLRRNLVQERFLKKVVAEVKNHRICLQILKNRPADPAEKLRKHQRAQAVAQRFPVLTERLPAKAETLGERGLPHEHVYGRSFS